MNVLKDRLIEFVFYFILNDLFKFKYDLNWLYNLIDLLAEHNSYNSIIVKATATKLLNDNTIKPYANELAIVLHCNNVPMRTISKLTKLNGSNIYKTIEDFKNDPLPIKLWFDDKTRDELRKFIQTYNNFKGIGEYTKWI